ncbi:MAG: helix-turn-helix domain-containing protein [Desulfovibrio sp.]|nr:helix-turn-helix domain-containing protein [Desulfovibrio sp.]
MSTVAVVHGGITAPCQPRFLLTQERGSLQVAEYLGYHPVTFTQMRLRGEGPDFIRRGRKVWYRTDAVLEWLDRHSISTEDTGPHCRRKSDGGAPAIRRPRRCS